jgi:hypothetical protein
LAWTPIFTPNALNPDKLLPTGYIMSVPPLMFKKQNLRPPNKCETATRILRW